VSSASFEFGDNVRVRANAVTEAAGLAGMSGQVYGFTTPSVTGITALGDVQNDRAYSVFIQARSAEFWLAAELLELVDHGAGTTAQIQGGLKMVRTADGGWEPVTPEAAPDEPAAPAKTPGLAQTRPATESALAKKKPWLKFWG